MTKKYTKINELKLQMLIQTGQVSETQAREVWEQFKAYEQPKNSLYTKILDLYFNKKS